MPGGACFFRPLPSMASNNEIDQQHFRDFESLEFFARQVVEGFITGMHQSPFHGFSVEFSEHRIYNPGESTRNIDWKLYGRTDRLYVKRYEEETNLRCRLVLDTSGSMYYPTGRQWNVEEPNKILFSVIASLALMNLFKKQRDAVGLSLFGQREVHTDARSTFRHHRAINTEFIGALEHKSRPLGADEKSMAESLHYIARQIHQRSLVILFSDLFEMLEQEEALFDALQHLKFQKHEMIIFWTTDRQTELDFSFADKPYRFEDLETGARVKLNPSRVREAYHQKMSAFAERLRLKCLQYRIELVEADVSEGYNRILQNYLLKRKRMM